MSVVQCAFWACVFRKRIRVSELLHEKCLCEQAGNSSRCNCISPFLSPLSLPPLSLSLLSPSLSSFLPLSPLSLSSLPSVAVEVHSLRGRLHEPTDDLEGRVPPAVSHGSQLSLGSSLTRPVSPDLSQQVCLSLPNQSYLGSSLSLLPSFLCLLVMSWCCCTSSS